METAGTLCLTAERVAMPATVISHYRLLELLGEGGMGVVYRAVDERLGREVAVKLLRTDAADSAEWLARFEREARLASSLHHPHICTIHELGEDSGRPFIAMERLEGQTVRRLLNEGPMAPERVLDFAMQIAEALEAAHRRGIIHRDIKPANLFVTHGDHVKVLDFGLAKNAPPDEPSTGAVVLSSAQVVERRQSGIDLTGTGVTVGTAAYMSPEQAQGRTLDSRSDLFSLGSVLYEMASGHRAFAGPDVPMTLAKIASGAVAPARSINPAIPEDLDRIILKLLAVDVEQRYQSAGDLLVDLIAARKRFEPLAPAGATSPPQPAGRRRVLDPRWVIGTLGGLLLGGLAAGAWFASRQPALTERDTIVVGDLDNMTGETIFDEALITALKAQLGQSPFLDIAGEQRIQDTLSLMGRRPNERLTHATLRDACQRLGAKAMLEASIGRLGQHYVLALSAADCQTADIIAREQAEATNRERVLNELGSIAKRMRTTLGESLPSIQRFDVPIEQATTPSLEALKAFARGLEERRRGRELESVAFFNRAIDLDRQFASAYATLSTVYGSLGEWRRSEEYASRAYALRNRVSERERLFIAYQYHDRVTADVTLAIETLETWKTAYPRDSRPANALALAHNRMGLYERAVAEAQEALRRAPGHPFPLSNLAFAYRCMGRYTDARRVAEEAVRLRVETAPTRRLLYQLGVLVRDGSDAAQLEWARDRPREFDLVAAEAEVAAFEGRMRLAADLYRRASDIAKARGLTGTAFSYVTRLAWAEALYNRRLRAAEDVTRVMTADADSDAAAGVLRFRAGTALGLAGLTEAAQALASRAEQRYPHATFVRTVLVPTVRAAISLRLRQPGAAIESLRAAVPTEFGTVAALVPTYLRAEALLQQESPANAITEYEKVLKHRGVDPFAPVVPMAYLGIARARARLGDTSGSRRAYEELLALWTGADMDFAPLAAARAEHDRLGRSPMSSGTP